MSTVTAPIRTSPGPQPDRIRAFGADLLRQHLARTTLKALMLVIVGCPLAVLLAMSLNATNSSSIIPSHWGLTNYRQLLSHADWITNTLEVAAGVTVLSTALGATLAWFLARFTIRLRGALTVLIVLPYPMGPLVAALAWSEIGSHNGPVNEILGEFWSGHPTISLNNEAGVILVQSLFQTPIAFLLIGAALRGMEASLEEASAMLGAGKLRTAWRITVPLMAPGLVGAALFSFISALGAFAVPTVLGEASNFHVATNAVYVLFSSYPANYSLAAAIGITLVVISAIAVALASLFLRRRSFTIVAGRAQNTRRLRLTKRGALAVYVVIYAYIVLALVLPLATLLLASVQRTNFLNIHHLMFSMHNYQYAMFQYPQTRQAIENTLLLAIGTAIIGVILATVLAITVERNRRRGRSQRFLEQAAMAPQAIPSLIFALAVLWLVLNSPLRTLYGGIGDILIAYVVLFLPLAYRSIAGVVGQSDPCLEEASRTLGASPARTTRKITVPLLRSGMAAGGLLVFMISVSAVDAAILLSGPNSQVLGPELFQFYQSGGLALISALAIVQTVIIFVALLLLRFVAGKRWQF